MVNTNVYLAIHLCGPPDVFTEGESGVLSIPCRLSRFSIIVIFKSRVIFTFLSRISNKIIVLGLEYMKTKTFYSHKMAIR